MQCIPTESIDKTASKIESHYNIPKQKRIPEKNLDDYLTNGWKVAHILKNGNFIVEQVGRESRNEN